MNTLLERGYVAQMIDVREMDAIYDECLIHPPDIAAVKVIKREGFIFHPLIQETLTAPALTR